LFEVEALPYMPYENSKANYLFMSEHEMFFCGEEIEQFKGTKMAWKWHFDTWELESAANMLYCRYDHGLSLFENAIYVFGGSHSGELRDCEKYSYEEDIWDVLPNLPFAISLAFSTVYGGNIYVAGGLVTKVVAFDPTSVTFRVTSIKAGYGQKFMTSWGSQLLIVSGKHAVLEVDQYETIVVAKPGAPKFEFCGTEVRVSDNKFVFMQSNTKIMALDPFDKHIEILKRNKPSKCVIF
jgi:hypothetical protein